MTDSAHRDEEIRMLTEKLRALESQLDEVRSSQRPGDDLPAQAALSDAIRASLEEEKADERQSLDELPEAAAPSTEDHHQPQGIETDRDVEAATHRHRSVSPALAESEDHVVIYFDDRSDELEIGEVEKVDQLAKRLRQEPGRFQVIISGFALAEGTPDFNELISSKRADAVRERLATRGVTQAGVSVRAMGQDRRHSDWKARRVEVHLQPIGVAESIN
ncbi:MAG: OmpA family protein [Verrucomicrobiota bacterium]